MVDGGDGVAGGTGSGTVSTVSGREMGDGDGVRRVARGGTGRCDGKSLQAIGSSGSGGGVCSGAGSADVDVPPTKNPGLSVTPSSTSSNHSPSVSTTPRGSHGHLQTQF